MKKIFKLVLVSSLLASSLVKADDDKPSTMDYLKDYGLPCAAAFVGGALASKNDGSAIGLGVCLGLSTSTYLQSEKKAAKMRDEDFKKFQKMMNSSLDKNNAQQDAYLKNIVADMEEKNKEQLAAVKQVMKEVIAERMSLVTEEVKSEIRSYVDNTAFMKNLETKVLERVKDEVKLESKASKKEIVEEVVDEVLKQIVEKKVGAPVN